MSALPAWILAFSIFWAVFLPFVALSGDQEQHLKNQKPFDSLKPPSLKPPFAAPQMKGFTGESGRRGGRVDFLEGGLDFLQVALVWKFP